MASYSHQWPFFIQALDVYKEVIQYELLFGDDHQYRSFAQDFPQATTSHAMASWLLFDVPHDQRPLADILLESQPTPMIPQMDQKLFRQFLHAAIQSYESLYKVLDTNDLSLKVEDLLGKRQRLIHWPRASKYFQVDSLIMLRVLYPAGSSQGYALTPPRVLDSYRATSLERLFTSFSSTTRQWHLMSAKDILKLSTPELWTICEFKTADEEIFPPFTPLGTERVETYMNHVRDMAEERDFSIAVDHLAQGLLGDFMEVLEVDEIVDYTEHLYLLHDLFLYLGGLTIPEILPAKPALLDEYFRTVAKEGMTFHAQHFYRLVHWASELFQFALVENEAILPYVEEMARLKRNIFQLISLLNTNTGLVFDPAMMSLITTYDDPPVILLHVWSLLELAGQLQLQLTPTGRLKKTTLQALRDALRNPYFTGSQQEFYRDSYASWLIDLLRQRGFLDVEEDHLILTPLAMLFWQQPKPYQYAILFQMLLDPAVLESPTGESLLRQMNLVAQAPQGKYNPGNPHIYTILDAYGMIRLTADFHFKAVKTPVLDRVMAYLNRQDTPPDNVHYLDLGKESR